MVAFGIQGLYLAKKIFFTENRTIRIGIILIFKET